MNPLLNENRNSAKEWWSKRRWKYNKGLAISGITAFICYCLVGSWLVTDFEVTLFTTFFQGIGYLVMMLIANIFYTLGYLVDQTYNTGNSDRYRKRLFNLGFYFSMALPFSIPLLLLIYYFPKP